MTHFFPTRRTYDLIGVARRSFKRELRREVIFNAAEKGVVADILPVGDLRGVDIEERRIVIAVVKIAQELIFKGVAVLIVCTDQPAECPGRPVGKSQSLIEGCDRAIALLEIEGAQRSEGHTSELQSLMRTSYAGFCLQKKYS